MKAELNFSAPEVHEYLPAVATEQIVESFEYRAVPGTMLVFKPEVSQKTKGGLVKSDQQIAEELRKLDYPMTVLAVGEDVQARLGIVPGTKVVINRLTATNIPSPIEGYDVVFVREHEVMAIKN